MQTQYVTDHDMGIDQLHKAGCRDLTRHSLVMPSVDTCCFTAVWWSTNQDFYNQDGLDGCFDIEVKNCVKTLPDNCGNCKEIPTS